MKTKVLTIALALLVLAAPAMGNFGGLTYHEVEIRDELRRKVTTITSVTVRVSGTTNAATIYQDPGRTLAITQPMTSSSTNTTLDTTLGTFFWYGDGQWDYTITDGTNIHTNNGFLTMSASDSWIMFPSFLQSINTASYLDSESITMGTDSDWVLQGGNTTDRFTAIPATADTAEFWIGTTNFPANLELYGSTSGSDARWDASADRWLFLDDAVLAIGTGSDYTVSHTGGTTTIAGTWSATGIPTFTTDVLFDGATDIKYDDSRAQLHFQDSSVLGIGGAADAAGDVTMTHDGSDFYLDAAIADEGWLIGDTTSGFDIAYRFETAGEFRSDYDDDFWNFTDDMDLRFGTGASADGDHKISSDSANLLTIDVVVAGVGEIAIGNDADDVPTKWYAETTSDWVYFNVDEVEFEDVVLQVMDDTEAHFGDDDDAILRYDETTDDNFEIAIASSGMSIVANDFIITTDTAGADQFKVDATGIVAGAAINLETTDGNILLNADGSDNGDINLNAADVISLIAADAAGIVVTTATFEHKYQYIALSAGTVTATEVMVVGGFPLTCTSLEAGQVEIGTTEGFVGIDDAADILAFGFTLPADFIDTGTQGDLIVTFDIDEQMGVAGTADIVIYEYDDAANATAIITDTIEIANDATRQWYGLQTNAAGIGNEADLNGEESLIITIRSDNDTDDFDIYGIRLLYRVGVQALQ